MSRVQLALNVADIDAAVDFYQRLFGTEPAKRRPGYANFAIADPPLKLVLIEDTAQVPGSLNHLGVEVESTEEVAAEQSRLVGAGLVTAIEDEVTCCFATQNKVWASSPEGVPWEYYTVLADADSMGSCATGGDPDGSVCCASTPELAVGSVSTPAVRLHRAVADRRPSVDHGEKMTEPALWRRLVAEFLGCVFLGAIVVGSGIAAQQLSPGNVGLQLLENAAATAAGLYAIILMFGGVSGAHFNPVVSFVDAAFGGLKWSDAVAYLPVQVAGCIGGAILANLMFALPAVSISTKHRASGPHFLSEIVATLGLLLVIFALARTKRSNITPAAVGAYIGAAYFFTSSTSFANPAIAVGRMFSNTFAGIAPSSVPVFVVAEVIGGIVAVIVVKILYPDLTEDEAADIIVPHHLAAEPQNSRDSTGVPTPVNDVQARST